MISICVKTGPEQRIFCFETSELAIGRAEENDLVLADERVSKRHCRILVLSGGFRLIDLKSRNGSFVNRVRVAEYMAVGINDEIRLGDHVLWLVSEFAETHPNGQPRWDSVTGPPGTEQPAPPCSQMRALIATRLISDSDLEAFCLDHFPDIKGCFTNAMDRTMKVNILLERAEPQKLHLLLNGRLNYK